MSLSIIQGAMRPCNATRTLSTVAASLLLIVAAPQSSRAGGGRVRLAQAQSAPSAAPSTAPSTPPLAATPPPAANATSATPAAPAGTPAVVIDGQQVESILGKDVRSSSGEDMGRIIDVIVDKTGQVRAAIIDFGGFLGVGSRQIAVDWASIRFLSDPKSNGLVVDLSRDQLRVAPAYKPGEQIVVLGQPRPAAPAVPIATTGTAAPPAKDAPTQQ